MFIRSELKEKAKQNIHKNIWLCIGVTLVFTLLSGNLFGVEVDSTTGASYFRAGLGSAGNISLDFIHFAIPAGFAIIATLMSLAYAILIASPIAVGHARYYLENRKEKSSFETLFFIFGEEGFFNTVKILLLRSIYLALWMIPSIAVLLISVISYSSISIILGCILSVLLLIPLFMKSYQYEMIPYILAENPTVDSSTAFKMTKEMTNGNKWNLFVLDLSFILWQILGAITCGIGQLYVNAYVAATKCEAYLFLKDKTYPETIIETEVSESEEVVHVEPTIDDLH